MELCQTNDVDILVFKEKLRDCSLSIDVVQSRLAAGGDYASVQQSELQ